MLDFEIPIRYLRENFDREDRLAVVLIDRASGEVRQKLATAERIAAPRFQAHLRAANAGGSDVYLSVNTIAPEAAGRTKADVETIRHVYLDVDAGGRAAVDRILEAEGIPNPHHILNTSPDKFQVIWSVEGFDERRAEDLVRGMARQFGADQAVWDLARVLRMPGFRNCKYETPHYVVDVHENPSARTHGPGDFPVYPREALTVTPRDLRQRSPGMVGNSQSERDWSYALRALARGESPAVIEARIEQFRQDKPDPRYYAHRTVSRAVLAHARSGIGSSSSDGTGAAREEQGGMDR